MLHPEQPLYVYELKGGLPPAVLDLEDLLGVWPEAEYTYLFFTTPAQSLLESMFRRHPETRLTGRYRLLYGEWQQLAASEPLEVDRFKIVTRCLPLRLAPDDVLLWLDPGVIFGSGLHPTTRGCLRALAMVYAETKPARVLDLGTGTGILAIAAAKLGASHVEAWDLNPMAVSTAAANCRRNGVADKVWLKKADAREALPEADLLCVNIHYDFLQSFLGTPELCRYGWAVVSGFLKEKLRSVLGLLPACATVRGSALEEHGWMTLILKSEGSSTTTA
jgi:ribosomal protein L11 methyltransferase